MTDFPGAYYDTWKTTEPDTDERHEEDEEMSDDRLLTDEELQRAIAEAERGHIETPLLYLRTSLGQNMSQALLGVLNELRARRAQDLSDAEREALASHVERIEECRDWIHHMSMDEGDPSGRLRDFSDALIHALSVLDRLIGGGK